MKMINKKSLSPPRLFLLTIFFLQFFLIIFFKRELFIRPYDFNYIKDRVEHSQWVLPLSRRGVSDELLYSYVGYQLVKGGNPAGLDAEVPVVGKDLIGICISFFKNSYYYSVLFVIFTLGAFFIFAKLLFQNINKAIFATLFFFFDPLFFSQTWTVLLDCLQLFFLLTTWIFIILFRKYDKKKLLYACVSGIFLGLFAETKFPILFPIIFITEIFCIGLKSYKYILAFCIGIGISISTIYLQYFTHNFSIISFLKLQKYIITFYSKSALHLHPTAIWKVIFIGKFPDIANGVLTPVREWWIVLPIIVCIGIIFALMTLYRNKNVVLSCIAFFVLSSLLLFTLIPSYPRYLLLVLPFIYFFAIQAGDEYLKRQFKIFLFFLIIFFGIFHTVFFLLPRSADTLDEFYYNFSHQYFQDIYHENISYSDKLAQSQEKFREIAMHAFSQESVKDIQFKELKRNVPLWGNSGWVDILITYKTQDLGGYQQAKRIFLIKENEEWKIKWDWSLIEEGFKPGDTFDVIADIGKRGTVVDATGTVAEDITGYLVSVNPERINKQNEPMLLKFLSDLGYIKPVAIQNAYLENSLPDEYIPVVTSFDNRADDIKKILLPYSGVRISPYPTRRFTGLLPLAIKNTFYKECCTRIYSSYNYHGDSNIKTYESQYDKKIWGYDGGIIVMKDKNGKQIKIVLEKTRKNGQDIVL